MCYKVYNRTATCKLSRFDIVLHKYLLRIETIMIQLKTTNRQQKPLFVEQRFNIEVTQNSRSKHIFQMHRRLVAKRSLFCYDKWITNTWLVEVYSTSISKLARACCCILALRSRRPRHGSKTYTYQNQGPASTFSNPAKYQGFVRTSYAGWHSLYDRQHIGQLDHIESLSPSAHPHRLPLSGSHPRADIYILQDYTKKSRSGIGATIY